jgi:hypothetical protein
LLAAAPSLAAAPLLFAITPSFAAG